MKVRPVTQAGFDLRDVAVTTPARPHRPINPRNDLALLLLRIVEAIVEVGVISIVGEMPGRVAPI